MMPRFILRILFLAAVTSALSGCGWVPKVPKVHIPFTGSSDSASSEDPHTDFNVNTRLAYGHTLQITAYHGLRSPSKFYSETLMVDKNGRLNLGKAGKVQVGGMTSFQAMRQIEGALRRQQGESIITVHLKQIEDVPLVTILGAVRTPGLIQWFDGLEVIQTLPYVGGRDLRSVGHAFYVTRDGVRKFFANTTREDAGLILEQGDIVEFSGDL
jgi:protein involved in polysaccharide export with SLBB domain